MTDVDEQRFAELLPIGHLTNARRALARYVENGTTLSAGVILDELDELRQLVLDVERAMGSLADAARNTPHPATTRAANALSSAGGRMWAVATQELQPAVVHLMASAPLPRGVRRGAA